MDQEQVLLFMVLLQALTIAVDNLERLNAILEDVDETEIHQASLERSQAHTISRMLLFSMLNSDFTLPRGTLTGISYGQWYIRPRSTHWWYHFEDYVMRVDAPRFKKIFRVSKDTFFYICQKVSCDLVTNTPPCFSHIPNRVVSVEKQVAIALKRFASGDSFITLSELFGVGSSTAARITMKFVDALLKHANEHLQWPVGQAMADVKRGFQSIHGLPNCCGAIDATHILMELPAYESEVEWYDRENNFSMLVQAIVDSRTWFLDVVAGYPGSVNDMRLLRNSNFAHMVESGDRLNGSSIQIGNQSVREYIIGDAGYPLLSWLIVPYPGTKLPPRTDRFNYMHSSTRMAVERAFGLLKKSWQVLNRKIYKPNKHALSRMILACCLLHNIMIDRGDRYAQAVIDSLEKFNHAAPYKDMPLGRLPQNTGSALRETLCDYLWTRR